MVFKKVLLQNEEPEFHGIIWAKPEKDSIDLKIWRGTSWWTVAASSFTPEQINQIITTISEQISPEDLGTLSRDQIYNLLNSKANTSDIPTSLSDLNDDATHRTVTDTEKQVWNNKQEPISDLNTIRQNASNAYRKPSTGIPLNDLSQDVKDAIENAGTLTEESDPIFTASPAHGITSTDISNWNSKQNALTFDSTPTAGSTNPVTSAGIKAYVDNATPTITMDNTPTSGSNNAVKSSGIYNALQGKQDTLTFDSTPTASSTNPVTSGGVKNALDLKANQSTTYTKTEVDGLLEDVAYLGDDDGQATTLDFDPQADTVWNIPQTLGSSQQAQARANIGVVDVSGTNDGTNWTSITIGSTTKAIPSGGSSGDENVIESITFNGTAATIDSTTKNAAISYTPPVTSVNNQTGAVSLALGDTNVIETVKVNGTALTPDANKAVDVKTHDAVTNHGTSDTTFALTPNVLHVWGTVTSLTLTLATPTDATIVNEYMFQFTSGTTATTLSLPSSVVWDEDKGALTVEANKTYQISIVNNIGLWASISNS